MFSGFNRIPLAVQSLLDSQRTSLWVWGRDLSQPSSSPLPKTVSVSCGSGNSLLTDLASKHRNEFSHNSGGQKFKIRIAGLELGCHRSVLLRRLGRISPLLPLGSWLPASLQLWPRHSSLCLLCLIAASSSVFSHLLYFSYKWNIESVTQLCLTLCNFMDCGPPGSSVHGILQARILEWVAILSSRGSSQPRNRTPVSCIAGRFFTLWATREPRFSYKDTCNFI